MSNQRSGQRSSLSPLIVATRDENFATRVAPALARWGFDVAIVATNLELVWRLTAAERSCAEVAVVVDTRQWSFGVEPLRWLRGDRLSCALVAIARGDDAVALEAAELAEAAGVVTLPPGRVRGGRIVRDIRRILHGRRVDEMLRWTPPRAARLRAPRTASSLLAA